MAPAILDSPKVETEPSFRERAIDAARQAAHVSHEARLFKSLAADAVEDGVHAARRAFKRRIEKLDDLRTEAAYRVKHEPLKAMGIAVGAGFMLGMAIGWFGGRWGKTTSTRNG